MKQETQGVEVNVDWQQVAERAKIRITLTPLLKDTLMASAIIVGLLLAAIILVPAA